MQAIDDEVFVFVADKYIQPLNNSKAYKVHTFRIIKFVIATHGRIE